MNDQAGSVSGGDGPTATTTSAETKVEVDRTTGDAVAEDSRQGEGNEAPADPGSKKIKFTSKIKRGLALIRMVNITALDETGDMGTPSSPQRLIKAMTKKQQEEYNAALDWIDQEEDWDAVAKVWTEAGGR